MKVYELMVNIYITNELNSDDSQDVVCNLIDKALTADEKYRKFHEKNMYKAYVFDKLVPFSNIYRRGQRVRFKIRTVNEDLCKYLSKSLMNLENNNLLVLSINQRIVPKRIIKEVSSVTALIAKTDYGYWRNGMTTEEYESRILNNLLKKYKAVYGKNLDCKFEDIFVGYIEEKTHLKKKYKNATLIGDKMTFVVAGNNLAQDLAYFSLGVGLLELGSRGYGFMKYTLV